VIGETTVRVRYAETDTMGVVYYGNYLTYFEVGRVEFLRQHGLPMSEVDRKRASFLFRYEIRQEETGDVVATGETRHACWHPETQRMVAIPEWLEPLLAPDADGGVR
jgi:acyl-CoA thioesterase FadM